MKLNINKSIRNGEGFWGVAIRGSMGKVCRVVHGASLWSCIDEVELDALEQGLQLSWNYGYDRLVVNVDSAIILHYAKMDQPH